MLFRPLELSDRAWIEKCRNADVQPFSALTFPSLLTWAETYGMTIGGDEDFYVIRSQHDKAYYMPCGREDKCAAFMEETARTERPARFVYATEAQAEALEKRGWKHLYRADLSEYILSTPALALSPGFPVTHSFRYKCRHFSKISPYTVREISFEDEPRLRKIAADAALPSAPVGPGDELVLSFELSHLRELGFRGVLVETEEGPAAFFLGYERDQKIFTLTMFRREELISPDVTAVCIHEFAKVLLPQYPLIDIEEDLGLDGLRREKTLLSPVDLLKVYEVLK